MKLATFEYAGQESWGIVLNNPAEDRLWIYEPGKVDRQLQLSATTTNGYSVSMPKFMPNSEWPETLVEFLKMEEEGMEVLRKLETFLIRFLAQSDEARMMFCGHPVDEVQLKSPIPQPRLMWGLVQNSPTFIRSNAQRQSTNVFPMGHQRPVGSVIGHGQMLYQPANTGNLTYNVELAIVIGKQGRYIPINKAMEYVAGYTVVSDYTMDCYHKLMAQDGTDHYNIVDKLDWYVGATMSWGGKMSDTHCGVGPWITTKEEIGNVYDLLVYTKMNGRMRDRAHTAGQAKMAEVVTAVMRRIQSGEKNLCIRPSDCGERLKWSEDFEDAVSGEKPDGWDNACAGTGLVSDTAKFSPVQDESGNQVYQIQYEKTASKSVTTHLGLSEETPLSGMSEFVVEMDATLYEATAGSFPYLGLRMGTGDSKKNGYEVRVMARDYGCAVGVYDRTDNVAQEIKTFSIDDTKMADDYTKGIVNYKLRVKSELVVTGHGEQQIAVSIYINDNICVGTSFFPKTVNFAPDSIRLFMYPQNNAASGVQKVTIDNVKIYECGHTLPLTPRSEVPATTEEVGTKAHYVCSSCSRKYLDEKGIIEVTDADLVIPKIESCMILNETFETNDDWYPTKNSYAADANFDVVDGVYQLLYTRQSSTSSPSGFVQYGNETNTILSGLTDYNIEFDTSIYKLDTVWSYLGIRMYDSSSNNHYEVRVTPNASGVKVQFRNDDGQVGDDYIVEDSDLSEMYSDGAVSCNVRIEAESYVSTDKTNMIKFSVYVDDNVPAEFDVTADATRTPTQLRFYLYGNKDTSKDVRHKATIDNVQIYTLTHPTEKMSETVATTSTWGAAGTKAYYTCGDCHGEFLDVEGTILKTEENKYFAALKDIKCQTRVNDSGLTDLRFVAYVDDFSQYSKIEMTVVSKTAEGVETLNKTMECKTTYTGVVADDQFVNTGDIYGSAGTFAAVKIMNNTVDHLKENMTITVKWYGADGNVAKETTRDICVFDEMPQK